MVNDMEPTTRSASGYVMFAIAATLGGINVLAVRISVGELAPFWAAGLRFSLAATLFIVITLALRLPWPRGRQLFLTIVNGLLGISLFYALAYWALVRVTAGTATVVLALVPLVTLLLASAHGFERLSRRAVAGSLLAVVGVTWIAIGPGEVTLALLPLLALVVAVVCVGESVIVSKMISANHPAITNAVSLTVGALTLLGMSAVSGEQWALPRTTPGDLVTRLSGDSRLSRVVRPRPACGPATDRIGHVVHVRPLPSGGDGARPMAGRRAGDDPGSHWCNRGDGRRVVRGTLPWLPGLAHIPGDRAHTGPRSRLIGGPSLAVGSASWPPPTRSFVSPSCWPRLSLATDLGTGQPMGHGLGTSLLAVAVARELGCGPEQIRHVQQVSLIRFLGCNADAGDTARMAGGNELTLDGGDRPDPHGEQRRDLASDRPNGRRRPTPGLACPSGGFGPDRQRGRRPKSVRAL